MCCAVVVVVVVVFVVGRSRVLVRGMWCAVAAVVVCGVGDTTNTCTSGTF